MHHTFKTHTDSLDNTYVLINLNIYTPKWTHPNEHTQMNTYTQGHKVSSSLIHLHTHKTQSHTDTLSLNCTLCNHKQAQTQRHTHTQHNVNVDHLNWKATSHQVWPNWMEVSAWERQEQAKHIKRWPLERPRFKMSSFFLQKLVTASQGLVL